MGRILVIEDDDSIRELIALNLQTVGYSTASTGGASEARRSIDEGDIDLAVLDIMLPDGDGFQLLPELRKRESPSSCSRQRIRSRTRSTVLKQARMTILPNRSKPSELIARIRTVLRRYARDRRRLSFCGFELDADARVVTKHGQRIPLTRREFDLLLCLAEHRGIVLSREKLLELAWGYSYPGSTRTVDVHVRRVRVKLGTDAIRAVPGTGYRLEG